MGSTDIGSWLQDNHDVVARRWLAALRGRGISSRLAEGEHSASDALYQATMRMAAQGDAVGLPELAAWMESIESDGTRGAAVINVPFVMVSTLRQAASDVLVAGGDASPETLAAWQALHALLDRILERLSVLCTQATQRRLGQVEIEAARSRGQLRSVYDVSQALNASLDEEKTFNTLVQKLGSTMHAVHCALWLSDVGELRIVATHGTSEPGFVAVSLSEENLLAEAFLANERRGLVRGGQQARLPASGKRLMDALGCDTLLVIPLSVQEIPIGLVSLGRAGEVGPFDLSEVNLIESIVNQAAIAIQNAGLYEEIRALNRSLEERVVARMRELAAEKERIETLYAIGRELSTSLDLNQILNKTLELVSQAVGAQYGSIMLLDRETDLLVFRAKRGGRSSVPPEGKPTAFRAGVGVAGWVLEARQPVLIPDVLQDGRWIEIPGKNPETRSLIAAPLAVGDDVHGVLLIADGRVNAFNESQFKLVVASARQVAQTISNVQLYNYILESADRLGQLLRTEQEERSKSQAILQSIADGVIVNDTRHNVIAFNTAAEVILGLEHECVLGTDVRQLFYAFAEDGRNDALMAQDMLSNSPNLSAGQVIETTLESEHKIVSARMSPVMTETGESLGVVTALRDITREVEADRAKSDFVSTVSHELRTPLTSIKGYADLLFGKAVGPINEHQERFLGIIKNNADRLTALINDLLDISRIETGRVRLKIELVNLIEIIGEVMDSMREQIEGKGLMLSADLPDEPAEIMGDRSRLAQIVTNLISNAYKYTDHGWVHVALTMLEEAVRLDVVDSGIGISLEDQGKIFDRFYRADTPVMEGRGGTGLGLAITKQLVELHGGRVWVKSEIGMGSTFTIILPVAAQELPQALLTEAPMGTKKILVVDDERDIVALLRYYLSARGYQVLTATTGEQAIAKAVEQQPDLITLDILLPDRHGFDVLRELKSRPETAQIPVIVLSVVQDEGSGYRMGAVDYIVKPVDERVLLDSVARIFASKGKILIADDAPETAEMLGELLKDHGYETILAFDGYETLSLARRESPGMILLDLRMPGMDGYEALTRLKKDPETNRIPILVMSGYAADPVQERLRVKEMGAKDFLSKPFSLPQLLAEIAKIAVPTARSFDLKDGGKDR